MVEESIPEYDQWRFKSRYHQMQIEWMNEKKIYPEIPFLLPDDGYQEMKNKIRKRRWEELASPATRINANIIREFYANVSRLDMREPPTYKSYVRGVEVDFSSDAIKKVLGLKSVRFSEPGYQQRLNEDQDYDEIARDICMENSEWEGDDRNKYKYLKRCNLTPEAKGWYELMKRSILGTVNTSEVNRERAVMLHCIIVGGETRVHEILAKDIQKLAEKNSAGSWLYYPSTIWRLCAKAKVPMEEENPMWLSQGMPITIERMMMPPEAHQGRRPHGRRQREEPMEEDEPHIEEKPQEEEEQPHFFPHGNMDMTQMQEAIGRLSQQYTRIQERQEEYHSLYMKHQQAQEERELRMMNKQSEFESRFLVMQEEHAFQSHESFGKLEQMQAENLRALKEFTTLQDARYEVQADYNINSQIKLNYIGEHLHNMDPAFPTFDEFFKKRSEIEVSNAMKLEDRVEEAMNRAGFWQDQQTTDMDTGNTINQVYERRKKKHDK
ncbi:uncharacterized protein DS421_12g366800 [Arachis hypogaea]|nr:uncharacterized protein DS421_12g366800 [Arachis hypogaea]